MKTLYELILLQPGERYNFTEDEILLAKLAYSIYLRPLQGSNPYKNPRVTYASRTYLINMLARFLHANNMPYPDEDVVQALADIRERYYLAGDAEGTEIATYIHIQLNTTIAYLCSDPTAQFNPEVKPDVNRENHVCWKWGIQ